MSEPLRIVKVIGGMHPATGGPPRVVVGAAVALAQAGHTVRVMAPGAVNEDDETRAAWPQLAAAGVDLSLYPRSGPRALNASAALATAAREAVAHADILHGHGVWDRVLVSAAAAFAKAGKSHVISPHGMLDRWSMARSRWKKMLALQAGTKAMLTGAAALVYGTQDEADEAAHLRLAPAAIVPNGVDVAVLKDPSGAPDEAARAALAATLPGSAAFDPLILYYGRLHPKKGADLLLDAFAALVRDGAPGAAGAGVVLVGIAQDAAFEAALRARAAAPDLAGRVAITTALTGPQSRFVLDAADVFALPSHQEGFSIAIIEAMARRLPVLITTRCHLPEVEAAGAGRVVAATTDGITAGLADLLAHPPDVRRAAGNAGAALVAERFTWPSVARTLTALYTGPHAHHPP